jgi:hypothetical protein
MKKIVLVFVLGLMALVSGANCPTSVTYNSGQFSFVYSGSTPAGTYNQIRVTIYQGQGNGSSFLLSIISNSGNTIVTDDAGGAINQSSWTSVTEYYNSGSPTAVTSCSTNMRLPVKLTSFKGSVIENQVALSWVTATEINNDRFEVERSVDGIDFEKVGEVKGNGNCDVIRVYGFLDKTYFRTFGTSGTAFYRLKQVDYDGQFEYSFIIKVKGQDVVEAVISPNPCKDMVTIVAEVGVVEIFDAHGTLVTNGPVGNIDMGKLPEGVYFLRLDDSYYRILKK